MSFEPVDYDQRDLMKDLPCAAGGAEDRQTSGTRAGALFGMRVKAVDDRRGVRVVDVASGSPAEDAGLKPGDLLTALDGRWTTSVADAYLAAATLAPGRPIEAKIVRDQSERTLTVTPQDGF